MTTEWKYLQTLQDVARAQADGWEVECKGAFTNWAKWEGVSWHNDWEIRGRQIQPKMQKVKYECFSMDGILTWRDSKAVKLKRWIRVPSEDKEIEVPE